MKSSTMLMEARILTVHKGSSKYINISFPPKDWQILYYSTDSQSNSNRKHLTAHRRTRKPFTLQHHLQITSSGTFVMQIQLRVTSRNWKHSHCFFQLDSGRSNIISYFFDCSLNKDATKSFPPTAWIIKLATPGNPSSRELSESSSRSTVTMFY